MAAIAALDPIVVNISAKTNWTFIAITTDDGATGWGECSLNGWEPLLTAYATMLAPGAIGQDIDATTVTRYVPHSPGGLVAHAVRSAIEQALVDLHAQRAGKSVAALLERSPRSRVPAYANINRGVTQRSPAGFADAARRAVAAGYRAVKIAPFDGVVAADAAHTPIDALIRAGIDRTFAVRDAVGSSVDVMVDCHWRFDVARAETLLRDIAPAKLYWIECMTSEHPSGFPAIARLTALAHDHGMQTAGGEMIAGADAAEAMCAAKLYDVLMPDIKYAGGLAGMIAIAEVCAAHGVAFAPHNPTGPIAHLASIHACAAAPTLLRLEHQWDESPLFYDLIGGEAAPLVDGAFVVPSAPGLGAAVDRQLGAVHPGRPLPPGSGLDERLG
jgi:galactonate dehydratase